MSISPARKLLLGGLTGLAVMAVALAPASAHKKHRKFHRWHAPVVVYSGGGGGGCSFYYWKWQNTGAKFWKRKYYACIILSRLVFAAPSAAKAGGPLPILRSNGNRGVVRSGTDAREGEREFQCWSTDDVESGKGRVQGNRLAGLHHRRPVDAGGRLGGGIGRRMTHGRSRRRNVRAGRADLL